MSDFRVEQVDHVEMFVPDRHEAARWYRRVLGWRIVPEYEHWADYPQGPLMISSDGGNTKLALFTGTSQGERPTVGFHLVAFRVDGAGFLAFLDRLESLALIDHRGREVARALAVDHGAAFSIYFNDPWGHRFEITTYDHEMVRKTIGA